MQRTKIVKERGKLDKEVYQNLTQEELDIKRGDIIQCSMFPGMEFEFICFKNNTDFTVYAECMYDGHIRCLYPESIKLSDKILKQRKIEKNKENKRNKKEKIK